MSWAMQAPSDGCLRNCLAAPRPACCGGALRLLMFVCMGVYSLAMLFRQTCLCRRRHRRQSPRHHRCRPRGKSCRRRQSSRRPVPATIAGPEVGREPPWAQFKSVSRSDATNMDRMVAERHRATHSSRLSVCPRPYMDPAWTAGCHFKSMCRVPATIIGPGVGCNPPGPQP